MWQTSAENQHKSRLWEPQNTTVNSKGKKLAAVVKVLVGEINGTLEPSRPLEVLRSEVLAKFLCTALPFLSYPRDLTFLQLIPSY